MCVRERERNGCCHSKLLRRPPDCSILSRLTFCISLSLFLLSSVTRCGDLLDFGQLFQAYFEMLSIGVENTFSRSKRRTKFSVARDIKNNFDKTFFSLILSGPDVT